LQPQDEERRLDDARCESGVVLDALMMACHEGRASGHAGEIAELANGIMDLRGEGYRLTARKVGSILRSFSRILANSSRTCVGVSNPQGSDPRPPAANPATAISEPTYPAIGA